MESKCDPAAFNYNNGAREKEGDVSTGMRSHRKRPASTEKDAFSTDSCLTLETEGTEDKFIAAKAPAAVPVEVLDTVFEFLDGNGLLSCEAVSYRWRLATDRTLLWKRACLAAFPHLGDYNFETPYACCNAYEGDWRETFLDGNRENRSAVVDWDMEAVADANGNPEESERRYFPPFTLCGYSFSLLADPGGNPRAVVQAQSLGTTRMEKGLSVYLTVAFHDELPGAPPWVGFGVGLHQPYPQPPLCLGPCHPWGEENGEDGERDEGAGAGGSEERTNRPDDRGDGRISLKSTGGSKAKGRECVATAGARVSRDPHGLRRRRRHFRRREGRVKGVSHAWDPATIARECCAAFSLAVVNKAGHKDIMWVSSMEGDRFFPGRRSWGVHCLLATSIIQNPEKGFLKNGSLTVRLRLRLLFLIAHVYTTADLASHRGFGVVPVRGQDRPFHYSGGNLREDGGLEEYSSPGSLSCLTFEVLRCTTLEEMEVMIAQALNLTSTQDLRLWVITQPLTDGPLAPRHLLSGENTPSKLIDDGQDSPSLFRLLRNEFLDDTCRVRLWAEQRDDAGFWEAEISHQRWQLPIVYADGPRRLAPRTTSTDTFSGVRLACTAGMPSWLMHSTLAWGSAGYPRDWMNVIAPDAVGSAPGQANNWAASGLVEEASALAGLSSDENEGGPAKSAAGESSATPPPRENRMLVFLKAIGLRREDENYGKGGSGVERPAYLTHVVLRGKSPLRILFELVAGLLKDGTAPEELGAYVEDLPCTWQGGAAQGLSKTTPGFLGGANAEPFNCSRWGRNRPSGANGGESATGGPGAGHSKRPKATPPQSFFACPPPEKMVPSRSFTPWTAELGARSGVDVTGGGLSGGGVGGAAAPAVSAGSERRQANQHLTLESAGVAAGDSICFFRAGHEGEGEAMVRRTYAGMTEELVEDMRKLLRGEGPLGRVHLIKLHEVVELCESMGYQGFRARIAHDQQRHVNPRETLEYVARGRHLAFICDSCGTQDFTGPRYHCLRCPDYDLCRRCHDRDESVPQHRYLFTDGHWKREGGFHGHTEDHELEEIWPVPAEGCDWRRWHNWQAEA